MAAQHPLPCLDGVYESAQGVTLLWPQLTLFPPRLCTETLLSVHPRRHGLWPWLAHGMLLTLTCITFLHILPPLSSALLQITTNFCEAEYIWTHLWKLTPTRPCREGPGEQEDGPAHWEQMGPEFSYHASLLTPKNRSSFYWSRIVAN